MGLTKRGKIAASSVAATALLAATGGAAWLHLSPESTTEYDPAATPELPTMQPGVSKGDVLEEDPGVVSGPLGAYETEDGWVVLDKSEEVPDAVVQEIEDGWRSIPTPNSGAPESLSASAAEREEYATHVYDRTGRWPIIIHPVDGQGWYVWAMSDGNAITERVDTLDDAESRAPSIAAQIGDGAAFLEPIVVGEGNDDE